MRRFRHGFATLIMLGGASAALSGRWPWPRLESRVVVRGSGVLPAAMAVRPPARSALIETLDTLRRGETVGLLLRRQGIADLELAPSLDPRRLPAGLVFAFDRAHADSTPRRVRVRPSPEQVVTFVRETAGWTAAAEMIVWRAEPLRIDGVIEASLYDALDAAVADEQLAAGDRIRLAWDLADVFAWQVDFSRDVQPGDRFRVVFERLIGPDDEVRLGRILASDIDVGGRRLTAFRFDSGGRSTLFDAEGRSLRRAFLRAPVEFRRISSTFARARRHPVLGIFRRHEGTDYSAAPGTPVVAAGDGVVLRTGAAGGYGNLVELRHRGGITTRYGHLRGYARRVRAGARVAQGQVIGYVGSSGVATGPHLHYEFRVNGVARDSRRVELGSGEPISSRLRPAFEHERDRLAAMLEGAAVQQAVVASQ